jgi:hypothetical protein
MQNYGRKASREELRGTHTHRWEDTEMDLRKISCEDVNMIDLNDDCVQQHHFISTVVGLSTAQRPCHIHVHICKLH